MTNSFDERKLSDLKQQAIDWLILLRSDDVSKDELSAFADWMASNPAHSKAFNDAEKLFEQIILSVKSDAVQEKTHPEKLAMPSSITPNQQKQPDQQNRGQLKRSHRGLLTASLAIAASVLFTTLLVSFPENHLFESLLSDYHTQTGELREINLTDGSHLLLNTNTAVSLNFNESVREVILHHGQARFTVAKDPQRPFNVLANGLKIHALGTVFQVYNSEHDGVSIAVQEHAVAVSLSVASKERVTNLLNSVSIESGHQLHYLPGQTLSRPTVSELNRETAWQQQQLILIDQPLKDLITELERYRPGRIFISDEKLNALHVTGVFSLKNPENVLSSVCQILNLQKTALVPGWVLLHR